MKFAFVVSVTLYSLLLASIMIACEPFATEIDAVLDRCCDFGVKQANSSRTCSSYSFNISNEISKEFHRLCRANIDLCCEKTRQSVNCQAGMKFGKSKPNCNDKRHSEMFQLCCNACKVGQQLALASGRCDHPTQDAVIDHIKNDCCMEFIRNETPKTTDDSEGEYDGYLETNYEDFNSEECDVNHTCDHRCYVRKNVAYCECDEGYQLGTDGFSCIPLNDKETPIVCDVGLKDNGLGDCEDINECESEKSPCSKYERCVNTIGSYICEEINVCPFGYVYNEEIKSCEDIDECSRGHQCLRTEVCENTQGSFNCKRKTCNGGYKLNEHTGGCDDINECLKIDCGHNMKCVNLEGSYICKCNAGLRTDPTSPRNCSDINECLEHQGVCDQLCKNSFGGYRCGCKRGFHLDPRDNRTCSDDDECEKSGKLYCPRSHCQNTVGSHRCYCPKGFRLVNERFCIDIDECHQSKKVCQGKNQECLNTQGSHRCLERLCDTGYRFYDDICYLMDRSLCFENSNEIDGHCKIPLRYGFTFGRILPSDTLVDGGRGLYHLNLTFNTPDKYTVEVEDFKSTPLSNYVQPADKSHFSFEKYSGNIIYKLLKPIEGPQEVKIRIWIKFRGNFRTRDYILGQAVFIVVEKPIIFS